jgi:hypothetical protein
VGHARYIRVKGCHVGWYIEESESRVVSREMDQVRGESL